MGKTVSPTRVKSAMRCLRKWALVNIYGREGLRPEHIPKANFGTKYHKVAEKWIKYGEVPKPNTMEMTLLLAAIASKQIPPPIENDALVEYTVKMDGINGRLDLYWKGRLIDHKTIGSGYFAPDEVELTNDIQACFYALAMMNDLGTDKMRCTWLYMCKTALTCTPKHFIIRRKQAQKVWDATLPMREAMYELIENPPKDPLSICGPRNPDACDDFGGCVFKEECKMSKPDVMKAFLKKNNLKTPEKKEKEEVEEEIEVKAEPKAKTARKKATAKKAETKEEKEGTGSNLPLPAFLVIPTRGLSVEDLAKLFGQ